MRFEDVKVGAKVRRIASQNGPRDEVGIIVRVPCTSDLSVCVHYSRYGSDWYSKASNLELVEPATVNARDSVLPSDAVKRKEIPIGTGVLDYFSSALAEVAKVSFEGNKQHNPGQPLHWSRGKSTDQYDTMIRHSLERGTLDTDGQRHSAKMAWRALAILQEELEAEGAPLSRGSRKTEAK